MDKEKSFLRTNMSDAYHPLNKVRVPIILRTLQQPTAQYLETESLIGDFKFSN